MRGDFYKQLTNDLDTARAEGLFKEERIITSAQQADITVADGSHVINFCANNYLGLANHPELIAAAKSGMDSHGFGMASVRFICGTQDSHKALEKKLADFLGSIPDRVSADPDRIFRIAKEHDRGSDLRWSEGIDRRKRKYESKCSITYTHVPVCIRDR